LGFDIIERFRILWWHRCQRIALTRETHDIVKMMVRPNPPISHSCGSVHAHMAISPELTDAPHFHCNKRFFTVIDWARGFHFGTKFLVE